MSRRWGYEDVWRDWYEAEDRVIVELRERSWSKSDPKDVMDQRTCCIRKFGAIGSARFGITRTATFTRST